MLSQVDSEGFMLTLMDGIVDYAKDKSSVLKSIRYNQEGR